MEKPLPVSSAQRGERKLPPPPKVAPWLVFSHGNDGKFHTFYDISDPMKKSVRKFIPELSRKRFWQKPSHQGWVVILNHRDEDPNFNSGDCFLWNPESLETIMLPNLEPFIKPKPKFIVDCVLSSPPHTSSNSNSSSSSSSDDDGDNNAEKKSMVFFLIGDYRSDFLIYCRPGDKEWRKHEFIGESLKPQSMFYIKWKLFIMGVCGTLLEIAIRHGCSGIDDNEEEILKVGEGIATHNNFTSVAVAGTLDYICESTVMESFGEVFMIDRYYIPMGAYGFLTNIDIAKLDFSSMAWEEVKSLDDYLGLPKGCVYFTRDGEISLYLNDLEDKSVLHCLPCLDLPIPWSSSKWLMITATPRRTRNHVFGKVAEKVVKAAVTRTNVEKDADKEDNGEARSSFIDNDDMVSLISDQLHTVDYIHLRAVSKKHRSMLNLRRSSSRRTVRATDLSPWLVFVKYDQAVYSFVSPMHNNENYLMSIPELLKGFTIRFSKGGWLLMLNKTLFFYHPFLKSIVRLPDLPDGCFFSGISFSSLPTSSDCIVFGIDKFVPDGDWTNDIYNNIYSPPNKNNLEFEPNFNNPVFYRGAFYCLDLNGTLGVFKLENGISWEILAMVTRPNCNLLCVLLGRLGKWVRVFRLNGNEMVWVEVYIWGGICCSLATHLVSQQLLQLGKWRTKSTSRAIFYSLDTGLYHSLGCKHSAKDYGNSKENLICSWIEPNCSETTSGQYLDWFNI
ncbi:hypothetical protein MKX01_028509 [Papaver californicum]|nr:hypothetical protein MKX01_028509 [Papaver californicum]